MSEKTLLVMAGGTGGHIMPALAVAEFLRFENWRVVWMGNPDGMESRLVPPRGFEMAWINFGALRGKGLMRKVLLPVALLSGFMQALSQIRRVRPDVVLGFGGYVTFPGGMMASLLGRPLVIHEQNSVAGLANRVLAVVADRVLTGFPHVFKKGIWVGNPVRPEIAALPDPEHRFAHREGPLKLLVVGGSLGAKALNEVLPKALALLPSDRRPSVIHQAGEKHLADLKAGYAQAGVDADCVAFIDDMATAYANADLVICRAGASTVSELTAAGVGSILVPFPFAVDDHQTSNARFLADSQAALLIPQPDLTPELLARQLESLARGRLLDMARAARALARPGAAGAVAEEVKALAGKEAR